VHNSLIGSILVTFQSLYKSHFLFFIHPFVQEQGYLALLLTGSDCIEDTGEVSQSCSCWEMYLTTAQWCDE